VFNRIVTLALVAPAAIFSSASIASCPDGWLDFKKTSGNGQVVFTALNNSDVPLTFTMELDLRRLSASRSTKFTESLAPNESRIVVTLTRHDESRPGNYQYTTRCTIGNKDADHDDAILYLLPYAGGRSYRVIQGYGSNFSHTGREAYTVDFYMKEGTSVHAARAGVIARIEESHSIGCWERNCGAYANFIVVVHDDDTTGEYYHLQKDGVLVEQGQTISAGQLIGLSGNTGHTTMPHLHFGVYRAIANGREQSIPVRYLSADGIINKPRRGGRYLATGMQQQLTEVDRNVPDTMFQHLH
jgi:murein DD-endopeptidase MepM/ murein hydrolase activator NlpD